MKLHALALIAGLAMTGSAYAITLSPDYSGDISGDTNQTSSFGAGETYIDAFSVTASGPINHSLTFNINTNLYAGSGVSDVPLDLTFGSFTLSVYNISSLSAQILDSSNNLYASFISNGDFDHLTLPGGSYFTAGNYTLKIGGTATGTSGGMYTVTAVTVPVPEPETYAMLLVGLGLVGYRLRQKNRAAKQAVSA
jgi:hypothetical protein